MKVKRAIDREQLRPLVIRNTIPVCMQQYERVFGSTRYLFKLKYISMRKIDEFLQEHGDYVSVQITISVTITITNNHARHIVAIYN